MTRRTRSHLLYLLVDAGSLALIWWVGQGIQAIMSLDADSMEPVTYSSGAPWAAGACLLIYVHILGLIELFINPERDKKAWKLATRGLLGLSIATLLAGWAVHGEVYDHLDKVGYVLCPAKTKRGRFVEIETFVPLPLPAECER